MKRGSPLRRTELKRGTKGLRRTRLKPVSKKRQKRMGDKAAQKAAEAAVGIVHKCEVTPYLDGVLCWEGYVQAWDGHPERHVVVEHHVWHQRWHDADWNVVRVCNPFNLFVEDGGLHECTVVSMYALHKAGRFKPETVWNLIRRDSLGELENWIGPQKRFLSEPVLRSYCEELIETYPFRGTRCRVETDF